MELTLTNPQVVGNHCRADTVYNALRNSWGIWIGGTQQWIVDNILNENVLKPTYPGIQPVCTAQSHVNKSVVEQGQWVTRVTAQVSRDKTMK